MRRLSIVLVAVLVTGCASHAQSVTVKGASPPTVVACEVHVAQCAARSSRSANSESLIVTPRVDWAAIEAAHDRQVWNETIVWNAVVAHNVETARTAHQSAGSARREPGRGLPAVSVSTNSQCGGDLPPCYVMHRESGGSYTAYNPRGCGGHACYGKWQFSGAWAGKLGLPVDIGSATPVEQDAAARALWAGGAGCSNWDAC